jgi:hypothetical protein
MNDLAEIEQNMLMKRLDVTDYFDPEEIVANIPPKI